MTTATSVLVLAAVAWPIALGMLWLLPAFRRTAAPLVTTLALPALLLAFGADAAIELRVPGLFTSMALGVDPTGRPFLLLTALLWSVVGVHAHAYMRHDDRRSGFTGFLIATGTGNIGLTIAQDALSFYLFFTLMTFSAYGLIVHTRTAEALRAGRIYIIMAVLGEALLLAGLFAVMAHATDAAFTSLPAAWAALRQPGLVATLLLLGFGVKAGLIPLHLWLPLAHPVAPTPASALLSGAMIKAGVLGWLRFLPVGDIGFTTLGVATMTAGVLATILAAALGLTQRDPKTVLAYSSISQIGFMTTGIGAALLLPAAAPMLVLAVAVYALHHAPAKAALFLGVGLVHGRASRWRLALAALPALVLAGAPLTSGALAKAALKRALGDMSLPWLPLIDLLLSAAAVGTTLLMARYLVLLAVAPAPGYEGAAPGHDEAAPGHGGAAHRGVLLPWLILTLLSSVAGVWLPLTLAPLGELPLATDTGYVAAAVWPIVLGVALAAVGIWLLRRQPRLVVPGVPAGDIVVLIERGAAATARLVRPVHAVDVEQRWQRGGERIERWAGSIIDRGAVLVERMAAGPALGVALCVMAALLFLALR